MKCFHNFNATLWEIFFGNLLFLFCSLFYLIWWVGSFGSNSSGGWVNVLCITAAFITGVVAIAMMSAGINSLSQDSKGFPVKFILVGVAILFLILLFVTTIGFHRIVTSELIIIQIWAALELSLVSVLYGTGHFGVVRAATLVALVVIATVIGLICYVLYYKLNGVSSYWDGMVPLASDALVMAVFVGVLAVS